MNRELWQIVSCPPAPTAPPTSLSSSDVAFSSITVQWGAVDCIHRNGDITGYSVRYGVQGSGSTQTVSVSGGATTEATVSGLESTTNYSIEVAAVNNAGTGEYSSPITAQTDSSKSNMHRQKLWKSSFASIYSSLRLSLSILCLLLITHHRSFVCGCSS